MNSKSNILVRLVFYLALVIILILCLMPIIWMFLTSIKPYEKIYSIPPAWIFKPTWMNYKKLLFSRELGAIPFTHYLKNSIIVSVISVFFTLLISTPAAYSLTRSGFKRSKDLSFWVLSIRMMPPVVAVIPLFIIFQYIRLLNTPLALIIAYLTFNLPLSTWLMKGFIEEIPNDLDEAAMIDGCSRMEILRRIIFPLCFPGLAATAILTFIFSWNEFLFALIMTGNEARTLPVAAQNYVTYTGIEWGEITTAGSIIILPVLIFTFIVQKYIVRALTFGAIK